MPKMVLGIFENRVNAEEALVKLEDLGYNPKDLSIVLRDPSREGVVEGRESDVAGGVLAGATTGGLIGAIAGLLVGIGVIAVPGIGALLIAGPLAAALGLTGAAAATVSGAATGALAGGFIGGLVSLGIPEEEARIYESKIREGAILVAVPARYGEEEEVKAIMRDLEALQIRSIEDTVPRGTYSTREEENMESQPAYYSRVEKGKKRS